MTDRPNPDRGPEPRGLIAALRRGWRRLCPRCGVGALFRGYVRTNEDCPTCGLAIHHHRADDAPPYFTIMAVGHIIVPAALWAEQLWQPAIWVHYLLWLPLTLALSLFLLPRIKGSLVGLQWALGMGGFDPGGFDSDGSAPGR